MSSDPEFDRRCIAVCLKHTKKFDEVVNLKNRSTRSLWKSKSKKERKKD